MNKFMTGAVVVACAGAILFVAGWLRQTGIDNEPELSDEITYICRETGQTIRGSRENPPAPGTIPGCQTLVQALYCPKCDKWHPMPPPEALERMPAGPRCRVHNEGLLEEIPAGAVAAARQ
ncbi:MAG: hypothetical protein HY290_09895 [Planctomycetia bacterium]|nr:hypothetical protein [Planctomycetia bacterium]